MEFSKRFQKVLSLCCSNLWLGFIPAFVLSFMLVSGVWVTRHFSYLGNFSTLAGLLALSPEYLLEVSQILAVWYASVLLVISAGSTLLFSAGVLLIREQFSVSHLVQMFARKFLPYLALRVFLLLTLILPIVMLFVITLVLSKLWLILLAGLIACIYCAWFSHQFVLSSASMFLEDRSIRESLRISYRLGEKFSSFVWILLLVLAVLYLFQFATQQPLLVLFSLLSPWALGILGSGLVCLAAFSSVCDHLFLLLSFEELSASR